MVKFSRELEAQLIPEWKDAFVNYRQLKKHVKKIKLSILHSPAPLMPSNASSGDQDDRRFGFSVFDVVRTVAARFSPVAARGHCECSLPADEDSVGEMELVQSRQEEEIGFFNSLETELEKVNNFYMAKESEFCERGEVLSKQLQILVDLKQILDEHYRGRHKKRLSASDDSSTQAAFLSHLSSSSFSDGASAEDPISEGTATPLSEEVIAALERNGISFVGSTRSKAKKGMKPKAATMRIDIPATTPGKTISAISSMVWEDLVNGARKDGGVVGGGDYINRRKIQCAEKMIRGAFVELYRGLGLLKTFSSLNIVAFTKILKKYDKVSKKQESGCYLKKVKRSHFVSSDRVVKLVDEVECIFTKHFASNDRKKAMKFLRPNQPKESHVVTFFVGLFTGSFVTLFSVYAILAHMSGIFSSTSEPGYMETVYPVFSMFALLSLHIFLYGCNIFLWNGSRINHNFIFDFNPNTALKYRDAFLICTSFMTTVVGAMVIHLILRSSNFAPPLVDAIPGTLLVIFVGTLIYPFNIFYRSTRYCLLRVMRNIIFSPFYKVLMVDFFMADQMTSQIPLLRYMEFTSCYFMAAAFKIHPYETCTNSKNYRLLAYIISFLPYYCRAMQCARRYTRKATTSITWRMQESMSPPCWPPPPD
ncbi:Phosphate transporter PHO1 [Platanthera guangdongensis]|uniref:Phosphate transporter PHO1 n=1 Tax=Platanthera guangdongensis TaxID=2320717 RepID=A0ABR2LRG9_9ASPA